VLVVTLVLAAIGFGLLVVALTTGSVAWAWACIVVCVVGAILLLVSLLTGSRIAPATPPDRRSRRPDGDRDRTD
jgi:Na+/melibiose symporter-like transporter